MNQAINNQASLSAVNLPYDRRNCCHQAREFSYEETKSAAISITTDEGDVVTLSSAGRQETDFALDYWRDEGGRIMNFTAESLRAESFDLSVQGDLNEEELNDIAGLMENLNTIAGDFFNGNLDEAMNGALNMGDLGSLATLSATFSHSLALSSSYLGENHPIPELDFNNGIGNDFKNLLKNEEREEISYAEMMRAQWQQIKDFIEQIQDDGVRLQDREAVDPDSNINPAAKMMEKLNDFAGNHPRLAAFAAPLAHQAVNQAAAQYPSYQTMGLRDRFNFDMMEKINDWMMA